MQAVNTILQMMVMKWMTCQVMV